MHSAGSDDEPHRPGRRRILFVLPSLGGGGAERVVTHLLRGLPPERFDLHLALLTATGPFLADVPPFVTIHDLGGRRARHAAPALVRLIWRLRPGIVLPTDVTLQILVLGLRRLLPPDTALLPRQSMRPGDGLAGLRPEFVWKSVLRILQRSATAVICPAGVMAVDQVRNFRVPVERIRLIPNPVDTEEIGRRIGGQASPYTGAGPHLVAIGRLAPQKGFDRLLHAFARIDSTRAHLWVLGTGELDHALPAAARRLGLASRVHFPGFMANPYVWLRYADLFVQSSRFEGSPNALLEALACGTRAVAFDAPGGTREILDGVDGTALVPDGDTTAFAAAIDRMLSPGRPPSPTLPDRHRFATVLAQYERVFSTVAARPEPVRVSPA